MGTIEPLSMYPTTPQTPVSSLTSSFGFMSTYEVDHGVAPSQGVGHGIAEIMDLFRSIVATRHHMWPSLKSSPILTW